MKQRFNNLDLQTALNELSVCFKGCRVANIYDLDSKTYLIKLAKPDKKAVILIESGIRIHGTEFERSKNIIPSGFSMKLRKHLRGRRLESVSQIGADRIVDLQFGSNEAAYHLIVELYDRGNILLTDFEYTIMNVLRPRTDVDSDVRFRVMEKYPLDMVKQHEALKIEKLKEILDGCKDNEDIKKCLTFNLTFGASLIEHCLSLAGFPEKLVIGKNFDRNADLSKLFKALIEGETIINKLKTEICKGYIIQKETKSVKLDKTTGIENDSILTYEEFHPYLFKKHESLPYLEFESFDKAVDEFFSKIESQKIELKETQQKKDAIKKLENVKKDHLKRIEDLKKNQTEDEIKAILIEYNLDMVDRAIYLVNSLIAAKHDWSEIEEIIDEAREENHVVASLIAKLKLETNHIVLMLKDPDDYDDEDEEKKETNESDLVKSILVEIDLGLNAFKNSRKYYESKKSAIVKELKTIDASDKALKNAEKKAFEILKQANKIKLMCKNRKLFWFEKFYWFISSENYLVIGGRDRQQNELVVKKYLKTGDLYVHADLHGASSVIIKNPTGSTVPPKTLNEAGCMAICYSVAWEAKVLANAWWVHHHQVSKQAPTGEYLGTGSFMIRGKKNFLPQTALVFGFGILYKLDDASIFRHKNDRKIKTAEEETDAELTQSNVVFEDVEVDELDETADKKSMGGNDNEPIQSDKKVEMEKNSKEAEDLEINKLDIKEKEEEEDEEVNEEEDENEKEDTINDEKSDVEFPETAFEMKPISKIEDRRVSREIDEPNESESSRTSNKKTVDVKQAKNQPLKRGQKTRLNKIKKKYKDQDEEDRELVMQYLASSGKESAKAKDKKSTENKQKQQGNSKKSGSSAVEKKTLPKTNKPVELPQTVKVNPLVESSDQINPENNIVNSENQIAAENNELEPDDDVNLAEEIEVIDSLTGQPTEEDEILFCLSVCAPYSTLQNYKHKLKLIPGTTKRGQAVKTALEIFVRDNKTDTREKDLIRLNLAKETDNTRNLPGRVKISAPNLNKIKKK